MKFKILIITIFLASGVSLFAKGKTKESKMYAQIETEKGTIKIELFYKQTPLTVANFVGLSEGSIENKAKAKGVPFYDGLKFHRVITKGNGDAQDFMVQGGDPQGTGMGDPGYKFADEFVDSLGFDEPFLLAMANSGPGTNGSQFFITVAPTTWLNQKHTIFGKVVEGQEVVHKIKQGDIMKKVSIIREGKEAKQFNAPQVFEKVQEELKQLAIDKQKNERKGLIDFVKKNYPKAKQTESGLYYVIEKEGNGKRPTAVDKVEVHYEGKLIDGKIFDSSIQRGETISFPLNQVIAGWTEGLQLIKEGGKVTLIIPYQMAYGEHGRPPVIPAKANLIFDVELFKVKGK